MAESVRLVIWDLDDTFWRGTVTEGGVEFIAYHHDLVIALAKRGILSSVCSKNDLAAVKALLEPIGLWQYFVFPSVNWEPKGARIAALIETMMLRPATVMFIDDNPSNLNEARHFVPDLQIATPEILPGLLENPLFRGKDDAALSRLRQYKVLETRREDERASMTTGGTNHDFLRSSEIRVHFEFDVARYVDRAVELINRTQQLNFTKQPLPEHPDEARAELLTLIARYDIQAALVGVADRYGDYGFVGFYAVKTIDGRNDLVHFCFSCRTLGMGIETWVYRNIGRPWVPMVGEVACDPRDESLPVDWISLLPAAAEPERLADPERCADPGRRADSPRYGKIILRGGCNGLSIAHYFHALSDSVTTEVAISRNGVPIRRDHSLFAVGALEGLPEDFLRAVARLGYERADFETTLFDAPPVDTPPVDTPEAAPIVLLDFWTDAEGAVYRHRQLGFRIPFTLPYHFPVKPADNAMQLPRDFLGDGFPAGHPVYAAVEALREEYEYEGLIGEDTFKSNLTRILSRIPATARVIILGAKETWLNPGNGLTYDYPAHASLNAWVTAVAAPFANVAIIDVQQCLSRESEAETINHFDRLVYYRIAQKIMERLAQGKWTLREQSRADTERRLAAASEHP